MKILQHYINGARVDGAGHQFSTIHNPATGEETGRVPFATSEEVDAAVAAADAAFPAWAATPPIRRARVMFRFKELLEFHMDEMAAIITAEHGKTIEDAKGSITRGLEVVEFACGIPHLLKGEFSQNVGTGVDSFSMRQPLGVCAGITPFNFPAMIPLWMFPLAVACGNCFILKPSERDPTCSLMLAELGREAGLPEGVLNVIHGNKHTVDAILAHRDVVAVSFVGSTNVAVHIYQASAAHGKRVQALGSAKNHMVVMPDADITQASDALVGAGFGSTGQRCMAVSVAVAVGEFAADQLMERLTQRVRAIRVGPGNDPKTEMGPLVSQAALDKVKGYIDQGVADGAELVVDGRELTLPRYEGGYFIGPCLFDKVTPEMSIYTDEIFGPVLLVVRAPDYETALGMASRHPYGNGAVIFTRDGDAARDFANRVEIGMVGVNISIPVPVAYHSFGGWKRSIFGDVNMHGTEGVRFYTKIKTVTANWPAGIRAGAQFTMQTLQ